MNRFSYSIIPVGFRAILISFLNFWSQKRYPGDFLRPEVILSRSHLRNCCIWWSSLTHISLPIGTNGKPLAAIAEFSSDIGKLMIDKTLATNGEEITNVMIGKLLVIIGKLVM